MMALAAVPVDLIEACRRGERDALERILRMISPDLYRLIFSMVRDHDQTDEIVQETMIRLFRHIKKLKDIERFAPWAIRIAVNQVHTSRLKAGRQRLYPFNDAMDPPDGVVVLAGQAGANPRETAAWRQVRERIELAMGDLPPRQQTAIVLFELEGCSIKEIANAMTCSEGAVKFNIHEARKKLKRQLGPMVEEWGAHSPLRVNAEDR